MLLLQSIKGRYSGKSDCLILFKNLASYINQQKTFVKLDKNVAETPLRSRASIRPDLESACLKNPIAAFCLTILIDLSLVLILSCLSNVLIILMTFFISMTLFDYKFSALLKILMTM